MALLSSPFARARALGAVFLGGVLLFGCSSEGDSGGGGTQKKAARVSCADVKQLLETLDHQGVTEVPLARESSSARRRRSGQGRSTDRRQRTLYASDGRATLWRTRGRAAPWNQGCPSCSTLRPLPEVQRHHDCWFGASHVSRPGKPRRRLRGRRAFAGRATSGRRSLGLAGRVDGPELQVCNSRIGGLLGRWR